MTDQTTHTPGPWKASDRWGNFGDRNRHEQDAPTGQASRFSFSVADSQGFVVAHCTNALITMSSERSEVNARLIAAAPDLLAALERLVAADNCNYLVETMRYEGYFDAARDAIAAAKGDQTP